MAKSSALPAGWDEVLQEIQQHLQEALAAVDARLLQMQALDTEQLTQQREQIAVRLQQCMNGLSDQLQTAETLVGDVDRALQESEATLHEQTTAAASVRQRLADWAGRAIG